MKLGKKNILSVLLVGLLCTAIYLNWTYNNPDNDDTAKMLGEAAYVNSNVVIPETDVFDEKRLERERAREKSLSVIEEILQDDTADFGVKETALAEKLEIAKAIEQEANCEILLKSKGFENVLVSILKKTAVVCVASETLIPSEIAQIQDIIGQAADVEADQIKIIHSH